MTHRKTIRKALAGILAAAAIAAPITTATDAQASTGRIFNGSRYIIAVHSSTTGSRTLKPGFGIDDNGGSFLISRGNWCEWKRIGSTTIRRTSAGSYDTWVTYDRVIVTTCGTY